MQRRATHQNTRPVVPPLVHEVLRSPGRPLDDATRSFMEPRFGRDLSNIRVHHDARAAESAAAVNALAYTVGQHIVFAREQYVPASAAGQELIAHELAHTVQQEGAVRGGELSRNMTIAVSGSMAEREADQAADSALLDGGDRSGAMHLSSLGLMLARTNCASLSYRDCITGVYKCGYGLSGTCGWGGMTNRCRCMGASQPSASRVLEILAILGLSLLLLATVIAALLDPEPASKLLLAGLSAAEAMALLLMLGYSEGDIRDMGLDPTLASRAMPGHEERAA